MATLEFNLLHVFTTSPGRAFSQGLLGICYQDGTEVFDRVIDVHVSKLRQKIEKDPSSPRYIFTIRGSARGIKFTFWKKHGRQTRALLVAPKRAFGDHRKPFALCR